MQLEVGAVAQYSSVLLDAFLRRLSEYCAST